MQEERKIKIKKKPFPGPANNNLDNNKNKLSKSLELLEKTVKKIDNKYKVFGFHDSKEEEFFEKYQQQTVVLELTNQTKITGKLLGIDKFRICVDTEGVKKYFFKHAILCYYAS